MRNFDLWKTSEPEELQDYRKRSRSDREMCDQLILDDSSGKYRCRLPRGHKGSHEWAPRPAWETQR